MGLSHSLEVWYKQTQPVKPSGPSAFCRRYFPNLPLSHFCTLVTKCVGFTPAGCPTMDLNSIYLEVASDPKAKSSVPQNCTPSFHPPGLLTDQIQTHNSLLRFTHFLEWLAELRKTVHLLDCQFITKGYNSGTERWKRCTGKDRRRGRNVHGLSEGAALRTFMYSPTWKLPKPHIQEFWGSVIT